jgi:hypothetical protein
MLDLLLGRPEVETDPHLYGYCIKALCELWGVMLSNDRWWAMRWGWFDAVTAAAGGRYNFAGLVSGGPGVPIPAPEDFPAMGHLTRAELPSHLARLDALDLTAIDRSAAASIEQARSWLLECRRDDMDLVCFYH